MSPDEKKNREEKDQNFPPKGKNWERGFTIEENRVAEYVELYESIGYEVCVGPAIPDDKEECQTCFKGDFDKLRTLYIKREKNLDKNEDLEELL